MTAQAGYHFPLPSGTTRRPPFREAAWPLAGMLQKFPELAWRLITAMARPAETHAPLSREMLQRFQATIVPHLDSAYNFARFLCRDPDQASDIVQDAFLRAYRGFDGYRGGDGRAWIFAIVRNCHRTRQNEDRKKARREISMSTSDDTDTEHPAYRIASEADTPEASTIRQGEQARVRAIIAALSETMREVLVLRELEDLSYKEISEVLDIPVGTVMSRLARARAEFGDAWRHLEASEGSR